MSALDNFRDKVESLNHDQIARHFAQRDEPFLICDGISIDVFNQYFESVQEPNSLRFIELVDGRVLINDIPNKVHEATVEKFNECFLGAFGSIDEITKDDSFTAHRLGHPHKAADLTYSPRTPTSSVVEEAKKHKLVTFVVEIARSQNWLSLEHAVHWWYGYGGVEYILAIKISEKGRSMSFRQYDVAKKPLDGNTNEPEPFSSGSFRHSKSGTAIKLYFDSRRLLAIPSTANLPTGVNDITEVDLRQVMCKVIEAISEN